MALSVERKNVLLAVHWEDNEIFSECILKVEPYASYTAVFVGGEVILKTL